jgi:hypothetical protein
MPYYRGFPVKIRAGAFIIIHLLIIYVYPAPSEDGRAHPFWPIIAVASPLVSRIQE